MSTITTTENTPATMVRGDAIVATIATSTARLIGAGAIAKATGKTIGTVKAQHALQQGSSGTLHATLTGKNRAGTLNALAEQVESSIVSPKGDIDYARAMREIAGQLPYAYAYEESVRADGQRVVKRASWLALGVFLESESKKLGKTGKPTVAARKSAEGLIVWRHIAELSEVRRNAHHAQISA